MRGPVGTALLVAIGGVAATASYQQSLARAADQVRRAWLARDAQAIVGQSPRVVLQIPGADPSAPFARAQAAALLRRHLLRVAERTVAVGVVREVEPGPGYVELERRYVVAGTSDERRETIYQRFRKPGAEWLLTELRSAP
jgi:hypothetical protein